LQNIRFCTFTRDSNHENEAAYSLMTTNSKEIAMEVQKDLHLITPLTG
jgi:hypothetical protein